MVMLAAVIRLRAEIERALRNRWLRPVMIVALALVLGLLVLHSVGDSGHSAAADGSLLVCFAITMLLTILAAPTAPPRAITTSRQSPRAPPVDAHPSCAAVARPPAYISPLRL